MELIQVGKKTYYIKNPTNIGIYQIDDTHVFLIDTGNDKDAGKKILKIMEEKGWTVSGIINTHSHADHIGGNKVIQERTGCPIYNYGVENCFTNYPILEPTMLYGGSPLEELKNKFLCAKESTSQELSSLPEGLEVFSLKGHSFDMIGIKTDDDVYFLGDSLVSLETIQKYHVFFLYDVEELLHSLEILKTLPGKLFIPSHIEALEDMTDLIEQNKKKVEDISASILSICKTPTSFEEILKQIFEHYELTMNINQSVLVGSTIRSYLSYLCKKELLQVFILDNKVVYEKRVN